MNVVRHCVRLSSFRTIESCKIIGACLGLRYLHHKGIVHGDIRGVRSIILTSLRIFSPTFRTIF